MRCARRRCRPLEPAQRSCGDRPGSQASTPPAGSVDRRRRAAAPPASAPPPRDLPAPAAAPATRRHPTTAATTRAAVQKRPGVHVRAGFDQEIHGGEHAFVGTVPSARDACAVVDAGGGHQRRDAFLARQIDQRLVLQQQRDELVIAATRRTQQRSGALGEHAVAAAILRDVAIRRTPLQLNVRIRALFEHHAPDIDGSELVRAREDGHSRRSLSSAAC